MSLEGLTHLSYVREREHGHVYIVRCRSADGTQVAGRLSYLPDAGGALRIFGRPYRKVGLGEQSADIYPLVSRFARDAVHLLPLQAIDHVWDPFAVAADAMLSEAPEVGRFYEELKSLVTMTGTGKTGLIGSRLVASSGVDAQSDFDIAVFGARAWAPTARLVDDWIRRGAVQVLCDREFPEFDARRGELGLSVDVLSAIRRNQWWRKLGIGPHRVSLSCSDGLGSMPARISETPAEVRVDVSANYVAASAPYVAGMTLPGTRLAGALHLSWFLRQGFKGTAKGRLAEVGGRQWVWVSKPEELVLDA